MPTLKKDNILMVTPSVIEEDLSRSAPLIFHFCPFRDKATSLIYSDVGALHIYF